MIRFLSNKSPIHFAGESGKGNTFLNGKQHVQNEKWTSIATVPDLCRTTVKILTHLISHYHLPLKATLYEKWQVGTSIFFAAGWIRMNFELISGR